jgi:hypothetical protein
MYAGHDTARFEQLKAIFTELSWDERHLDPELAFGAHISVPHLQLMPSRVGAGLAFSASGRLGPDGPDLSVIAIPVPIVRGRTLPRQGCVSAMARMFEAGYAGPFELNENGIVACDGWGTEKDGRTKYYSALVLPSGTLLNAVGWGDPDEFRSALLHMHVTRKIEAP